jgi:hypothetical protein
MRRPSEKSIVTHESELAVHCLYSLSIKWRDDVAARDTHAEAVALRCVQRDSTSKLQIDIALYYYNNMAFSALEYTLPSVQWVAPTKTKRE